MWISVGEDMRFYVKTFAYSEHQLNFFDEDHKSILELISSKIEAKEPFIYSDSNWLGDTSVRVKQQDYFKEIDNRITAAKSHKTRLNEIYQEIIPRENVLENCFHDWRFNVVVDNKKELLHSIFKDQLFASSHYPVTANAFVAERFPNAQGLYDRVINLFNDFRFDESMAVRTAQIAKKHIER